MAIHGQTRWSHYNSTFRLHSLPFNYFHHLVYSTWCYSAYLTLTMHYIAYTCFFTLHSLCTTLLTHLFPYFTLTLLTHLFFYFTLTMHYIAFTFFTLHSLCTTLLYTCFLTLHSHCLHTCFFTLHSLCTTLLYTHIAYRLSGKFSLLFKLIFPSPRLPYTPHQTIDLITWLTLHFVLHLFVLKLCPADT